MYFITTTTKVQRPAKHRTFGYFEHYTGALYAVLNNIGSMDECLYDYLVIEYIPSGIHPNVGLEEWYEWIHLSWVKCDKPEIFKGIVNWALG